MTKGIFGLASLLPGVNLHCANKPFVASAQTQTLIPLFTGFSSRYCFKSEPCLLFNHGFFHRNVLERLVFLIQQWPQFEQLLSYVGLLVAMHSHTVLMMVLVNFLTRFLGKTLCMGGMGRNKFLDQ